MAEEQAHLEAGHADGGVDEIVGVPPQIFATPGMPERKAVARRQARVRENLHLLPKDAQAAILDSLEGTNQYPVREFVDAGEFGRHGGEGGTPTGSISTQRRQY